MEELNEKLGPALFGALEIYLTDLVLTCLREPIQAFGSDADYLANVEASFLLQSQIVDFRKGLRPASVLNSKVTEDTDGDANKEKRQTQPHQVLRALQLAKSLLDARLEERLRITHKKPRVLRLCDKIGVTSACEVRAFLFVVSINAGVELPTTGTVRPTAAFMARFAGMTTSEFLQFLSEERPHFKQGLIGLSDHRFKSTLSDCTLKMPREVLAALTGAAMLETEVLKIDKTSLADILQEEEDGEDEEQGDDDGRRAQGEEASAVLSDEDERQSPTTGSKPVENGEAAGFPDSPTTTNGAEPTSPTTTAPAAKRRRLNAASGSRASATNTASIGGPSANGQGPYQTDLEYLGDVFRLLATLIKMRNAEAEIKDDDPEFLVQPKTEAEAQLRELRGKERVQRSSIERRLQATRDDPRGWLPRVEALAAKRGLAEFDRLVLLLLVGGVISHDILIAVQGKYVMRGDDKRDWTVGFVLYILCDSLEQRVQNRAKFYKSAPLVKDGIITVSDKPALGSDLMDCLIDIDRRMLDYLVGLDCEFSEVVEGSHLFQPVVRLDNVVLPAEQKGLVLATVTNFDAFTQAKARYGLDDVVSYGSGLVLLFHGPSGTGKTMLANAIAREAKKRLLLVNLSSIAGGGGGGGAGAGGRSGDTLKLIFREAKLHDAIIFFDECETFFEARQKNPLVLSLLSELERYQGLIILATNRAYSLDEAMHRRITLAIEFRLPDHLMRLHIWRKHIPTGLPLAEDVSLEQLALDYELSGGLIKNALLSALSIAVSRDGKDARVTMEDLRKGSTLQLRGFLREESGGFGGGPSGSLESHRVVPRRGLEDLVVTDLVLGTIRTIVNAEKGRKLLYTQWGFSEDDSRRNPLVALFVGPTGTGKSLAAEAVACEAGACLKVVNVAELVSKSSADTARNVERVFHEAQKEQAILVLDDAERLFTHHSNNGGGSGEDVLPLVSFYLARVSRLVLILVRSDSFLDTRDVGFVIRFVVRFTMPTVALRKRLWRVAVPTQTPLALDVSLDELAERHELTGAQIRTAAFFAASRASMPPSISTSSSSTSSTSSTSTTPGVTRADFEAAIGDVLRAGRNGWGSAASSLFL